MAWPPTNPLSHSQMLLLALHLGNNQLESEGKGGPHSATSFALIGCVLQSISDGVWQQHGWQVQGCLRGGNLMPTPHPAVQCIQEWRFKDLWGLQAAPSGLWWLHHEEVRCLALNRMGLEAAEPGSSQPEQGNPCILEQGIRANARVYTRYWVNYS